MKLERYKDKKETRRKVILISLTVLTLVSITMVLYKTFAKFTTSTSFSIMSGKVVYKKKGPDFGIEIPVVEEGTADGLYAVEHPGAPNGWDQIEYRYAGANVNNYVYFNCTTLGNESATTCEKWRIIGLVNVKTSSNKIEQRIKIVKPVALGNLYWDNNKKNDWTKATLMKYLNSDYYSGLKESAKDMIEKGISWTLGGIEDVRISGEQIYQKERGTNVYSGNATEWNINTTINPDTNSNDSNLFRSIGLMYASDYRFAFGGINSQECRDTNTGGGVCPSKNWAYNAGGWAGYLLTHSLSKDSYGPFVIGWVAFGTPSAFSETQPYGASAGVEPSLYVSSKFHITHGSGTDIDPYVLG